MIPQLKGYEGLESKPGSKIIKTHVRVGLEFYPQDPVPALGSRKPGVRVINWDKKRTEATLLGFSWNKTIGEPSGKWTATVKVPDHDRLDIKEGDIFSGDWMKCTVMRNGVKFVLFYGIVDHTKIAKGTAGGATTDTWTLTGRDHGAVSESPILWSSLYAQTISELIKGIFTEAVQGSVGGSPDVMFKTLITAVLKEQPNANKTRGYWKLPGSLVAELAKESFFEALTINIPEPTRGAYFNQLQLWTKPGQNLHATLGQWCNPLLNEYYFDTVDGKMIATIRERPFVLTEFEEDSKWFDPKTVTRHKIPNWLIEGLDVGRGGYERFNLFELLADFGQRNTQEQPAIVSPLFDQASIAQHGLRVYSQQTKYIGQGRTGEWAMELKKWMRLLVDWYGPNPYYYSGTMSTGTAFPEIKIGSILEYDEGDKNMSFYVEGVSFVWGWTQNAARSRSSFTLTRGFPDTDRLKMVKDISAKFKGFKHG